MGSYLIGGAAVIEGRDYRERVYAGVLGKIIGVYLGRPVEGWSYERIRREFGEVSGFVNERTGQPLVVTDDDISGTFTFLRAMDDYGCPRDPSAEQVGQTWLNYLVEGKTILWWGGRGQSTEHTAFLNLLEGVKAPESGSRARNGAAVANQIGAMIFIDGWALLSPGDPSQAARFARTAASVSHDEEALNAAAFIAAMEAAAFLEKDLEALLGAGLGQVPPRSAIARQVEAVRGLHRRESDWRVARAWLDEHHGYRFYPGTCHVIPNFSLIILALLYGQGDFRKSMTIVNSSGWDTDCNAANLGCLLGIRGGLAAIESCPDLREPHLDLMFISSADGGRAITDAAREACAIAELRSRMLGEEAWRPKDGARLHFAFRGAVHGFRQAAGAQAGGPVRVSNIAAEDGSRALEIRFAGGGAPAPVSTPVFIPPEYVSQGSYDFQASPSLYQGQLVRMRLRVPSGNPCPVAARIFVGAHGRSDERARHFGAEAILHPGEERDISWAVEAGQDSPIFELGLELRCEEAGGCAILVDRVDWGGVPTIEWRREGRPIGAWTKAWVQAVDSWATQFPESFRLSQNRGTGLLIQGMREWGNYSLSATLAGYGSGRVGIAARVQGLRRYYALVLGRDKGIQLLRELDGTSLLAERSFAFEEARDYSLRLEVEGFRIRASVDGRELFDVTDSCTALGSGAIALLAGEGTLVCDRISLALAGQ